MATRVGWVLNLDHDEWSIETESDAEPVLVLDDGALVFEVWKWYPDLSRWFVLSWSRDRAMEELGVIFYAPDEAPHELRARVDLLRQLYAPRLAG